MPWQKNRKAVKRDSGEPEYHFHDLEEERPVRQTSQAPFRWHRVLHHRERLIAYTFTWYDESRLVIGRLALPFKDERLMTRDNRLSLSRSVKDACRKFKERLDGPYDSGSPFRIEEGFKVHLWNPERD